MALKKATVNGAKGASKQKGSKVSAKDVTPKGEEKKPSDGEITSEATSKKRKAADESTKEPSKASRRSARGAPAQAVDPVKMINFLLSPDSLPLCSPKDELSDLEKRGSDTRTYSTGLFNPFEELVCALILSRPIGHMLGLRSIRTLFNDPHNLSSPKAIKAAGKEGCRLALDEARTQHRQKTAEELVLLADAVTEHLGNGEDDVELHKLRETCGHDIQKERAMLKEHVKGMAKTGIDIFARRVQGIWKEWYPFADEKTVKAMENLGLAGDAEELSSFVVNNWADLETGDILGKDEDEKRRNVFVMLLERAVGAGLEGNVDAVKQAIS